MRVPARGDQAYDVRQPPGRQDVRGAATLGDHQQHGPEDL